MARYIFVTGGVVSSLGKGITSASLAYINQNIDSYAKFNFGRYTLREKKSLRLIGMCGFLKTEMGIDFGYRLSKDIWGCGLGFEAANAVLNYGVDSIGLKHFVAGVMPDNFASIKILDKLSSKNKLLSLKIGEDYIFKNLVLKVLKCKNSEFDDNPEITAYIQVRDLTNRNNNEDKKKA